MLISVYSKFDGIGYIAGLGDGIVTALGKPASRSVYLLDAVTMDLVRHVRSLPSGRYIFTGIDETKEYIVMVRDYKKELEPFSWDHVVPADDLTVYEQQALWASWHTL